MTNHFTQEEALTEAHPQASEPAPSTAGEATHQGINHEQQVRPEMDAVDGQQPVEGAGNSSHIDRANLVASILALLALDADGALVPHGVGGHARKLLTSAAALLQSTSLPVGELTDEQIDAAVEAWFGAEVEAKGFKTRMRLAIEAAHKIGGRG